MPENTFAVRTNGLDKISVDWVIHINMYHKFTANNVFNSDRMSVLVVPKSRSKVFAKNE